MFQIDNSFLHSKFARRIFLLFLLSAIIPVTVIAILSFNHLARQFYTQSHEQSRIVCKAIGMELYRRLSISNDELLSIQRNLGDISNDFNHSPYEPGLNKPANFDEIMLYTSSGNKYYLYGKHDQIPELNIEQQRHLVNGKGVIQFRINSDNLIDVYMIQAFKHEGSADDLLVGKVNTEKLFAMRNLLPPYSDILILDDQGMILKSSTPSLGAVVPHLKSALSRSISGHVDWSLDGKLNYASYWSIFTQNLFSNTSLIVVVSQPESIALAPLQKFKTTYIPVLVFAILFVSLISVGQIRRRLIPLGTLRKATERIASGDLRGRIDINSDDEFANLGESFNIMANNLEMQFTSLATFAEIDRLILSSFDVRFIISTVLSRIGELTPCSSAAILLLDGDKQYSGKLWIRRNMIEDNIEETHVRLGLDELSKLQDNQAYVKYSIDSYCPAYLRMYIGEETQYLIMLPTFIKDALYSILIFGYSAQVTGKEQDWASLHKFADHIAIALSNAGWEERLYHQAHYDALTKLPNRALLKDRLEQAITRAQRNHSQIGLMFLDLDRFKLVNDSLGHTIGDRLLKNVADILVSQVRKIDTVVRFGGDEFIIIISDIDDTKDPVFELGTIAKKIFKATQHELEIEHHIVHPKMSIGIALYPNDGLEPEELIKNADAAMYHAKSKGRGRYDFYANELNDLASHRLQLEMDLRRALVNNEFQVVYQPKVDCRSGHLLGAEALIRWHHPVRGIIPPLEFIPIAEETGLIVDIGEWVMRNVCRQIVAWCASGLNPLPIAVNVSPNQFQQLNFIDILTDILKQNKLEPSMLELEITETTIMSDSERSIEKLNVCRAMGLNLAMDDFGTGYSSLSYLRNLPIHTLKIDKSFISSICEEDDACAIVNTTISLAHQLGQKVVAEGVESEEQRHLLQEMSCDAIQGYLISKPLPAEKFSVRFLQTDPGDTSIVYPDNTKPCKTVTR